MKAPERGNEFFSGEGPAADLGQPADRLTTAESWESIHRVRRSAGSLSGAREESVAVRCARRIFGKKTAYFGDYAEFLMGRLLQRLLPAGPLKAIEVGSAPGRRLIWLHRLMGYEPYGVEYAREGVELNRAVFREAGLDENNVILADFMDQRFIADFGGRFDVVMSHGFIEHFRDPAAVVRRHLRLLRPGGYVVIDIPNKRGLNGPIARFFRPDVGETHNTDIMRLPTFRELFDTPGLEPLFTNYLGVFKWSQFGTAPGTSKHWLLMKLRNSQRVLNFLFRIAFGDKSPESGLLSPYLVYVGRYHGSEVDGEELRGGDSA